MDTVTESFTELHFPKPEWTQNSIKRSLDKETRFKVTGKIEECDTYYSVPIETVTLTDIPKKDLIYKYAPHPVDPQLKIEM